MAVTVDQILFLGKIWVEQSNKPVWNLSNLGHLHPSFILLRFHKFFWMSFFVTILYICNLEQKKKRHLEKFVRPKQYEDVPKSEDLNVQVVTRKNI